MMKRMLALLIVIMLAGCGTQPATPPPSPKPAEIAVDQYFPATAGSVWKYKGVGNEFAQFIRTVTFRSGNRAQVEDASGANVASVYVISATEVKRVFLLAEDERKRSLLTEKENRSDVILRSPLKQGETWKNGDATFTIEAVGQTVTVPAGTYKDVVQVKSTQANSNWTTVDHFAPGVGLVKRDSTDGKYTVSSLLESYTLGK
jgi:hypothetical protein